MAAPPINSATQQVYWKRSWTAEWQLRRDIWCNQVQFAVAPQIGVGRFEHRYGVARLEETANFAIVEPIYDGTPAELDLIKVVMAIPGAAPLAWFGVVTSQDAAVDGTLGTNLGAVPKGVQLLTAHELSWLLTREPIRTAWVEAAGGEAQIGRGLTFNERTTQGPFGDLGRTMTRTPGPRGVRLFAADPWEADPWNAYRILEHVLAYHVPKGENPNAPTVPVFFRTPSELQPLEALAPTVETDNRSLWEIITGVLDRRRLLSVWCDVDEDGVGLRLVRFNEQPLTLYSSDGQALILPANPSQVDVVLSARRGASATVSQDLSAKVSQVVVRGARRTSTFSLSHEDGTLEKDWTDEQETEYEQAASTQTGYAALAWSEKRQRNDEVRRRDELQRVFCWFKVTKDWDGKVGDGEGGPKKFAFPKLHPNTGAVLEEGEPFWQRQLRLDEALPLFSDTDYTGAEPEEAEPEPPEKSSPERLRSFALLKVADNKWSYVDKLTKTSDVDQVTRGSGAYSGGLEMRHDVAGLKLKLSGAPQYKLSRALFTPLPEVDEEGDFNWQFALLVTVAAESDTSVEVRLPPSPQVGDVARRMYLDVPEARLDYIVPNTVYAVDEEGALKRCPGGFVRDDRWLLRNVAEVAWKWYSASRRTASVNVKMLLPPASIGDLLLTLDVNIPLATVVTTVDYDFDSQSIRYATNFAEFSVEALAREGARR